MWDVIIYPCPNANGGLAKALLNAYLWQSIYKIISILMWVFPLW